MTHHKRVVIVGAGQAGGECAQRLRAGRFEGEITLVGEEPVAPYQRPPLSKAYLLGKVTADRLLLRDPEVMKDERIVLELGVRAQEIDRRAKRLLLSDGRALNYDALVLATGASPREPPCFSHRLNGQQVLRTVADADALRPFMRPGVRAVVVGAGFIGLEAAAVARSCGLAVTVIEMAPGPLARVTSPEMAQFFWHEHRRQGVQFEFNAQVDHITGEGAVTGVVLRDGRTMAADLVVAGIGVVPNTALAEACGLDIANGVVTDRFCRTSDSSIYAIGDCSARPMPHYGDAMFRLESVHNAIEGAKIVASQICGYEPAVIEAPWFWSDQYDLKLQIAGLLHGYDRMVTRGDPASRSFAAFYYKKERLLAVDAVNRPAEFLGGKLLIQSGKTLPPDVIADDARPMKTLLSSARAG